MKIEVIDPRYRCLKCEDYLRTFDESGTLLDVCRQCLKLTEELARQEELDNEVLKDWFLLLEGEEGDPGPSDEYMDRLDAVGRLMGWASVAKPADLERVARALGFEWDGD